MMALAPSIGREVAHDALSTVAASVAAGKGALIDLLTGDKRINAHLDRDALQHLLDLPRPAREQFAEMLLSDWPTYLAYLFAFFTIGSIWLSHHNAFTRIRRADPVVLVLNLVLLLGASLVPWPTALVCAAVGEGSHADQVAAILACALVMLVLSVPWCCSAGTWPRPGLLGSDADRGWMRRNMWQSAGVAAVALVGAALAFLAPLASLVLFVVVPASFLVVNARSTEAASQQ